VNKRRHDEFDDAPLSAIEDHHAAAAEISPKKRVGRVKPSCQFFHGAEGRRS
jgi:hypothetical protein